MQDLSFAGCPRMGALRESQRGEEMANYGTTTLPRTSVVPGMLVKYQGRTYRASANVDKGLYLFTLLERLRTTNEEIEVYLNQYGRPAIH